MDTNFTQIGQLFQIIEHFTFLPLFVFTRAIYLNSWKACKLSQFYAANKKAQNWGKVGLEKWVGVGPFLKFWKIVLEFMIHSKNSSNAILGIFKFE